LINQEDLFNLKPKEHEGFIERTEIEYIQLAFADDKKIEFIRMLERLCVDFNYETYQDLLFDFVKEKYEEDNS